MNSLKDLKDKAALGTDPRYVIFGATGHTGSIIANSLLSKGQKVRMLGATRGDCSALCARRGSVHGRLGRCGCARQRLQRCERGLLDVRK